MQRLIQLTIISMLLLLTANTVFAYSYAEPEDKMAKFFKEGLVAVKSGEWDKALGISKKMILKQKYHMFPAERLEPGVREAIKEKDVSKTAGYFANLVYLSMREKLHQNKKDEFKHYKNSKARLGLARKAYIDVLDGNVKKQDPARSEEVLKQFDVALESIGNPGLFGVGKKKPDSQKYEGAVRKIEEHIEKSFPYFSSQ